MVVGGTTVTVTLNNGLGGATDWIAFADVSAPNSSYVTGPMLARASRRGRGR